MRWDTRDYVNYSGGDNLYRYAEGNPVRYVDPSGNSPLLLIPPLFAGILLVPNTVGESGSASTWNEFRLAAETALVGGGAAMLFASISEGNVCPESSKPDRFRREPRNLSEQLALEEAKAGAGRRIMSELNDPRFKGKHKMRHAHRNPDGTNTIIHYILDPLSGKKMDFKFKE